MIRGTVAEIGKVTTLDGRTIFAVVIAVDLPTVRAAAELLGVAVDIERSVIDHRSGAPCEGGFADALLDTGARADQDTYYARR
jgi:hypothetical protein